MASSTPGNQGDFGTCAAYALATAVVSGMLTKYNVVVNMERVLSAIIGSCWDGMAIESLCKEWNTRVLKDDWFEDTDSTRRYRIKLGGGNDVRVIASVEEAYTQIVQWEGELLLLTAIALNGTSHAIGSWVVSGQ